MPADEYLEGIRGIPGLREAITRARPVREPGAHGRRDRVRPRGPAPAPEAQQGARRRAGRCTRAERCSPSATPRWDGRQRVRLDRRRALQQARRVPLVHRRRAAGARLAAAPGRSTVEACGSWASTIFSSSCGTRCASATATSTCATRSTRCAEKLDELLDLERDTLAERRPSNPDLARRSRPSSTACRTGSPTRSSSAQGLRLRGRAGARPSSQNLLEELENIQRLEDFQRRYGDLFHGPKALDYERALELMREMRAL